MRVHEIMSKPVETIAADVTARAAWDRMRAEKIRHLVVMDGRAVIGVVSSRDLGGRRGEILRAGHSVRDLMMEAPVTARPDMQLKDAANLMRGRSIGCLPVCGAKDALVGIVTVSDLLASLGRGQERPVVQGKRWTLKHRGPRRA